MVHNVTANDWGHWDDMYEGDRFTASFDEEGIFPFACTYHPGMSGAIVVGDGGTGDDGPGGGRGRRRGSSERRSRVARARHRRRGDRTGLRVRARAAPPARPGVRSGSRLAQTGTAMPACCIASSKSCRFETALKAASTVIFPSCRSFSIH